MNQIINLQTTNKFKKIIDLLLSEKTKEKGEKIILSIAIIGFIIHLALIYLVDFHFLNINSDSELIKNPIAAIYTPFSFILVYEVYLLIYYLPKSITIYITKQYEIITLIIIRRIFKDLSNLKITSNWFQVKYDLNFTYDIVAAVLLFYLIYLFYIQSQKVFKTEKEALLPNMEQFIRLKKIIAAILVPVMLFLATYSFANWLFSTVNPNVTNLGQSFNSINNIFFDKFFTVLIIVDVVLLLLSFFHTDKFHKVIRNSGFIISTILIRLSFSVDGLINTILIVSAITFGLLILTIHNQFEKKII